MRTKFLVFISIVLLLLSSCAKEEDYYSLNDIWLSLGIVDTDPINSVSYAIYCDNGDTLIPISSNVPYFDVSDSQRVLVNFTILDEVGTSTDKFYVKINNLQEVLFKDIIELTTEISDSLGNDSIRITDVWVVNDMMNIEFKYLGGRELHYINLCYSLNEYGEIEEPVNLVFRHNANNDEGAIPLTGLVTFKLSSLKIEGKDSIAYRVTSDFLDDTQAFEGIYTY